MITSYVSRKRTCDVYRKDHGKPEVSYIRKLNFLDFSAFIQNPGETNRFIFISLDFRGATKGTPQECFSLGKMTAGYTFCISTVFSKNRQ